ncbi:MAG: hypothetical protein ACR2HM_00720 [Acidimicrobiales bacterium]
MSIRDDPGEQLLDLLVYAPLGLVLEALDLVPKLAEKGRQRMGGQVTAARMIGELAVRQGQRRADTALKRLREHPREGAGGPDAGPRTPTNGRRPAAPERGAGAATPAPEAGELAIPGYDTLSASQVVPRLEGLTPAELDAVGAYEQATRGRKTVLTRIDQLRGA